MNKHNMIEMNISINATLPKEERMSKRWGTNRAEWVLHIRDIREIVCEDRELEG